MTEPEQAGERGAEFDTANHVALFLYTRLTDVLQIEGRDDAHVRIVTPRRLLLDVAAEHGGIDTYEINVSKKRGPT
jgi:hypothetical protein